MRSKLKLGNIALLLASSAFALLPCELIARLILNPVDYLSPVLVRDETKEFGCLVSRAAMTTGDSGTQKYLKQRK